MRLTWLSPLPPAAGPAAELTATVLPLASERAEVVLITGQESWDPALEKHATVVRARLAEPPWARLNRADMTVFSIGGDAASGAIWRLSQRHPGLVILQDEPLWPLFVELARAEPVDRERLADYLEEVHGPSALGELDACLDGSSDPELLAERYPLTALAARGALAVLVGSEAAAGRLSKAECPVAEAVFPRRAGSGGAEPTEHPTSHLEAWIDVFEALLESARRQQPLSAVRALARAVSDELDLWSGFPGGGGQGPLLAAGRPHPLHRRVVSPVADAVDELLKQTRAGRCAAGRKSGD